MTQEEIIEMATEAGLCSARNGFIDWIDAGPSLHEMTLFAKLVADKEREACAKVCDVLAVHPEYASSITKLAAQAIRNRGQA